MMKRNSTRIIVSRTLVAFIFAVFHSDNAIDYFFFFEKKKSNHCLPKIYIYIYVGMHS